MLLPLQAISASQVNPRLIRYLHCFSLQLFRPITKNTPRVLMEGIFGPEESAVA